MAPDSLNVYLQQYPGPRLGAPEATPIDRPPCVLPGSSSSNPASNQLSDISGYISTQSSSGFVSPNVDPLSSNEVPYGPNFPATESTQPMRQGDMNSFYVGRPTVNFGFTSNARKRLWQGDENDMMQSSLATVSAHGVTRLPNDPYPRSMEPYIDWRIYFVCSTWRSNNSRPPMDDMVLDICQIFDIDITTVEDVFQRLYSKTEPRTTRSLPPWFGLHFVSTFLGVWQLIHPHEEMSPEKIDVAARLLQQPLQEIKKRMPALNAAIINIEDAKKVFKDARNKFRKNQKACLKDKKQKRSDEVGAYLCITGCGRGFRDHKTWKAHEEKNYRQQGWCCTRRPEECCDTRDEGRVFFSKEHYRNHLRDKHDEFNSDLKECDKQRVQFEAFPRRCCFSNCIVEFSNWKMAMSHLERDHFTKNHQLLIIESTRDEDRDPDNDDAEHDDEDEEHDDDAEEHGENEDFDADAANRDDGYGGNDYQNWTMDDSNQQQDCSCSNEKTIDQTPNQDNRCPRYQPHACNDCDDACPCLSKAKSRFGSNCSPECYNLGTVDFSMLLRTQKPDDVRVLGRTSSAIVQRLSYYQGRCVFARKLINASDSTFSRATKEASILQALHHPHVVRYLGHFRSQDDLCILMYPAADTDLLHFMKTGSSNDVSHFDCWSWFACLASGLQYIHSLGIRHRDIKPSNILLEGDHIFYADFGLANLVNVDRSDDTEYDFCTRLYAAPELRLGRRGRAADIWSLGCVFLELISFLLTVSTHVDNHLRSPNPMADNSEWTYANDHEDVQSWIDRVREAIGGLSPPISVTAQTIARACRLMTQEDPLSRPSANGLVQLLRSTTSRDLGNWELGNQPLLRLPHEYTIAIWAGPYRFLPLQRLSVEHSSVFAVLSVSGLSLERIASRYNTLVLQELLKTVSEKSSRLTIRRYIISQKEGNEGSQNEDDANSKLSLGFRVFGEVLKAFPKHLLNDGPVSENFDVLLLIMVRFRWHQIRRFLILAFTQSSMGSSKADASDATRSHSQISEPDHVDFVERDEGAHEHYRYKDTEMHPPKTKPVPTAARRPPSRQDSTLSKKRIWRQETFDSGYGSAATSRSSILGLSSYAGSSFSDDGRRTAISTPESELSFLAQTTNQDKTLLQPLREHWDHTHKQTSTREMFERRDVVSRPVPYHEPPQQTLQDLRRPQKVQRTIINPTPRPKFYCKKCDRRPEGFRGAHGLRRHISLNHSGSVLTGWICVDASPDGTFLIGCKYCRDKKIYGAYYNAAAHLRRVHFQPRNDDKSRKSGSRAGRSGGEYPPLGMLQAWMKKVEYSDAETSTPGLTSRQKRTEQESATNSRLGSDLDSYSDPRLGSLESSELVELELGIHAMDEQPAVGNQPLCSRLDSPFGFDTSDPDGKSSPEHGGWFPAPSRLTPACESDMSTIVDASFSSHKPFGINEGDLLEYDISDVFGIDVHESTPWFPATTQS